VGVRGRRAARHAAAEEPRAGPHRLLRRTKLERAADLTLPPKRATLRRDFFDAREEDFYQALYTQSQASFAT